MNQHPTAPKPSQVQVTCRTCQKTYWTWPCHVARGRRYCSNACKYNDPHMTYEPGHSERTAPQRFEALIEKTDGCWLWKGSTARKGGYGTFTLRHGHCVLPHRYAYELWVGPIPPRMKLLHSCDNPACVNPAHLSPGTQAENVADAVAKDRHGRGERHAKAKLTETQVLEIHRRHGQGERQADLAREFGMSFGSIHQIVNGTHWKHLLPGHTRCG